MATQQSLLTTNINPLKTPRNPWLSLDNHWLLHIFRPLRGAESRNLWKRLLDKRRCVVLFDGFYEWKARGSRDARLVARRVRGFIDGLQQPVLTILNYEPLLAIIDHH